MPPRTPRSAPRVEVIVDDALDAAVPVTLVALVARLAEAALAAEHSAGPDRVTVFITLDETLRDLNHRFNGLDEVTDVLSFNDAAGWKDGQPPDGPPSFPDGGQPRLGDVVISLPQAVRQAGAAGDPAERELAVLTVHGVLHLLGYDHALPAEERVMFGKTERVIASAFSAGDEAARADRNWDQQPDRRQSGTEETAVKAARRNPRQRVAGPHSVERAR